MPKYEILVLDYLPDDNGKYKLLSFKLSKKGTIKYKLRRLSDRKKFFYQDESCLLQSLSNKHRGVIFRLDNSNGQTKVKTIISLL